MKLKSDEKRTLAAAVVVLLVGVIGGGAPYAWRHAVLRDRIDQAERQLGFDRQRERNLTHLASEVAAMQEMVRGSQKYVPAEPEVASFLRMLSEELAAVGVSAELKQRDRVEGRDFTIVPVDVEFEGGFGAAQRFIARTESMPMRAATEPATARLSPVIMATSRPSRCSRSTASADSGRIASSSAIAPRSRPSAITYSTVRP